MRLGIPIWNDRVSPVLDTAERVLVVDSGAAAGQVREVVSLGNRRLPLRATRIGELGLDLLVCGAISTPLAQLLNAAGVHVRPWVTGEIEDVIAAVERGRLDRPCYRMPGCCGGRGARRRGTQAGRVRARGRNE